MPTFAVVRALCVPALCLAAATAAPQDRAIDLGPPWGAGPVGGPITIPESGIYSTDVAYDASDDVFFVVWSGDASPYTYPPSRYTVGQLVGSSGGLVGGLIRLEAQRDVWSWRARVANVRSRNAFVVVWEQNSATAQSTVEVVAVDASTGAITSQVTVASQLGSNTNNSVHPDVGGNATPAGDDVLVTWFDGPARTLRATQLRLDAALALHVDSTVDLAMPAGYLVGHAVSKSGGAAGRHFVTWQTDASQQELYGAVVEAGPTVVESRPLIAFSGANRFGAPDVDGDGEHWLLAYELGRPSAGLACLTVTWDENAGSSYQSEQRPLVGGERPSVAWAGESFLVAHGAGYPMGAVTSVDRYGCSRCEGTFFEGGYLAPGIASQRSGDPAGGDLALHASRGEAYPNVWVELWRFAAEDGAVTDLGGGCGAGGAATAGCAIPGHAEFALRLRGAAPGRAAVAILGTQRIDIGCGACTLIPDPATGLAFGVGTTNARGEVVLRVPLPNAPGVSGASFYHQWLTVAPASSCAAGLELSDAVFVEIE